MAKYDPLRDYLSRQPGTSADVLMTFTEVEALVGPLPASARTHRAWWANDSKVQAQAWRAAGWQVSSVDQPAECVVFARGVRGGTYRTGQLAVTIHGETGPKTVVSTVAVPDSGMSEAAVQAQLVAHLIAEGWQIRRVADTAAREQGIDILATRGGRTLAVEVKGYPSRRYADERRAGEVKPTAPAGQARHWYAQAVLKAMLTRNDHPDYDLAIALPDVPTYRNLTARTKGSLDWLDIGLFFITDEGWVHRD